MEMEKRGKAAFSMGTTDFFLRSLALERFRMRLRGYKRMFLFSWEDMQLCDILFSLTYFEEDRLTMLLFLGVLFIDKARLTFLVVRLATLKVNNGLGEVDCIILHQETLVHGPLTGLCTRRIRMKSWQETSPIIL